MEKFQIDGEKGEGEGGMPHLFVRPYVRFLASIRRPDLNDHREGANHRMNDDRDDGRERGSEGEIDSGNRNIISGNRRPIWRLI